MMNKFLANAVVMIAGKPAEDLVDILKPSKHINEALIAKKLGITVNQTRNILYKLSDHGLVSSKRKKEQKKGWYTYFWKLERLKALEFVRINLSKRLSQIQNQIESRESKVFYFCERCYIEFNEENALLQNFTCHECGAVFAIKDNSKLVKEMKKTANRIEKEIELVEDWIDKEKEKEEKKKARKIREEKKKKEASREAKKKATKKTTKKKSTSKKAKKKVATKKTKVVKKKVVKKPKKKAKK